MGSLVLRPLVVWLKIDHNLVLEKMWALIVLLVVLQEWQRLEAEEMHKEPFSLRMRWG
jgi:hypothetical protein